MGSQKSKMAASAVLPTHQRFVNGVPVPPSRRTFRMKEKYVLLLVFVTFGSVCFGAMFFLPNLEAQIEPKNIREVFVPQPGADNPLVFRHDPHEEVDEHKVNDKHVLKGKIEEDKLRQDLLENIQKDREQVKAEIDSEKDKIKEEKKNEDNIR